jgi:hypothetical protein
MGSDRFGWARIEGGNVAEEGKNMGAKGLGREEGPWNPDEDEEDGGGNTDSPWRS